MRAGDVTATVEAGGLVEIRLPRLRVLVEGRQGVRLRDALNAALPEQIEDLMHDPRVSDVDVLRAARAILAERGQDTESLSVAIESIERTRRGVREGDRVRDPLDGTWREVVRVEAGTAYMADGGCMGIDECLAGEIRLPGEVLD